MLDGVLAVFQLVDPDRLVADELRVEPSMVDEPVVLIERHPLWPAVAHVVEGVRGREDLAVGDVEAVFADRCRRVRLIRRVVGVRCSGVATRRVLEVVAVPDLVHEGVLVIRPPGTEAAPPDCSDAGAAQMAADDV